MTTLKVRAAQGQEGQPTEELYHLPSGAGDITPGTSALLVTNGRSYTDLRGQGSHREDKMTQDPKTRHILGRRCAVGWPCHCAWRKV